MVPKGTSGGGAEVGGGLGVSRSGVGVLADGEEVEVGVAVFSISNWEIASIAVVLVSVGWMAGADLVVWATTVRATAVGM